MDATPEEVQALLEEAVDHTHKFEIVRQALGVMTQAYIDLSNMYEEEGEDKIATVFAAVSEDTHSLFHIVDDLITSDNGRESNDGTDEDH